MRASGAPYNPPPPPHPTHYQPPPRERHSDGLLLLLLGSLLCVRRAFRIWIIGAIVDGAFFLPGVRRFDGQRVEYGCWVFCSRGCARALVVWAWIGEKGLVHTKKWGSEFQIKFGLKTACNFFRIASFLFWYWSGSDLKIREVLIWTTCP